MAKKEKTYTIEQILDALYDALEEDIDNLTANEKLSTDMKFASSLFKMSIIASVVKN